ncbi:MAG: sensor histidine kinase, partial [Flavipsychrobacter sp.]
NALMNPHFMFNSLNSIQYFINNDNKLSANKYLNVFSKMLRQNMLNISKEMITLQNEIDLVINYLNLEKLRFKDGLQFSLNIDETLELEMIKVPPLLLQPIVENAIKHGLLPKQSTDNYIEIRIQEINDDLHIEIRDNGVGLGKSSQTNHTSFALENMNKRINQLRAIYGIEISIAIEELSDNEGTVLGTRSSITIQTAISNHRRDR